MGRSLAELEQMREEVIADLGRAKDPERIRQLHLALEDIEDRIRGWKEKQTAPRIVGWSSI